MTVPLDRLYHYIESVAQDIRGDTVVIYRFTPHGSKKVGDLRKLRNYLFLEYATSPHMYCNDQEPLDYEYYQNIDIADHPDAIGKRLLRSVDIESPNTNFQLVLTVFDKALLLHSEERSVDLEKYRAGPFVPVYYWSHAIISLDWFRYAQHINQSKQVTKKFLVYNRAWSGTREYRLKFVDLLIDNNLQTECLMTFNSVEPELHIHYTEHKFVNTDWEPTHKLEDHFDKNITPSHASADFELADYQATDFEVVLETLFDDERLQLTEKVLRPIAVGQPFLHVAPHGSLKYLQRYGFKTFNNIIDESYDNIKDPAQRLRAVVNVMNTISKWTDQEREEKMLQIKNIVDYNKGYFFSDEFFNLVVDELKNNFKTALIEQETTNTGKVIDWRKKLSQHQEAYNILVGNSNDLELRKGIATFIKHTRKYYLKKH